MSNNQLLMWSLNIPYFEDIKEFSRLIGLSSSLLYCLSNQTENYYKHKDLPKKNGGFREICIPSYSMRIVQKWILINIIEKLKPSKNAMAFRKSTQDQRFDIKQNAFYHSNSLYGLTIDLKDFFPSITSKMVFSLFKKVGYNNFAAQILTNICTLDGSLPQGAVTSPALSNLICIRLDNRLEGLCKKREILYSRYADDMFFSCDNKVLLLRFFPIIETIITSEGFIINEKKVHFQTRKNRRLITGVIVTYNKDNPELKAPREFKKKIRAEIFKSIMSGDYTDLYHIRGEIAHVCFIEGKEYLDKIKKYISSTAKKIEYYPELVDKYNNHLFYSDIFKIQSVPLSEFRVKARLDKYNPNLEDELTCQTLIEMRQQRKVFLEKNGLDDICEYLGWPELSSIENDSIDEELPF